MLRTATADDISAIVDLAVVAGMFSADDASFLHATLRDAVGRREVEQDSSPGLLVDIDESGAAVGAVFWQPREAADRVWDVTMIVVHAAVRGRGRGAAMMQAVEDRLRTNGQRLVIVETSSTAAYARAREFYAHLGYDEEARVRDYWEDGDDMIIYRKSL